MQNAAWQARYTFHSTDPLPSDKADYLKHFPSHKLDHLPSPPRSLRQSSKSLMRQLTARLVAKVEDRFSESPGVELPRVGLATNGRTRLAIRCAMVAQAQLSMGIWGAVRNEMQESYNEIAKLQKAGRGVPDELKGKHEANTERYRLLKCNLQRTNHSGRRNCKTAKEITPCTCARGGRYGI